VLHERRRDVHARVVDAIEQLYADRLAEQVERLAHHAMRGEKREKAVPHLWQAGGKAAARSALSDARAWFEQALGVLEALPGSRARAGAGLRDSPRACGGCCASSVKAERCSSNSARPRPSPSGWKTIVGVAESAL